MRIASGVAEQVALFKAVDTNNDPVTGLSSGWTVHRCRNGGTVTAMTTPTITELSSSNMPGWYKLLMDEDMTVDGGNITEMMGFCIKHASIVNADIYIELFDADYWATATALQTAQDDLDDITGSDGVTLATAQANYAPAKAGDSMALTSGAVDDIWDEATSGHSTAGTTGKAIIDILEDTDELQTDDIPGAIDGLNDPTAGAIADAVWEEAVTDHSGTAGSTAEQLAAAGAAGDPWATALPGSYTSGQAGKIVGDNLNATVSSRMPTTHIDATEGKVDGVALVDQTTSNDDMRGTDNAPSAASIADAVWDEAASGHTTAGTYGKHVADIIEDTDELQQDDIPTSLTSVGNNVTAVKNKTDSLTFTKAGEVDANIQSINNATVSGDGSGDPWDAA